VGRKMEGGRALGRRRRGIRQGRQAGPAFICLPACAADRWTSSPQRERKSHSFFLKKKIRRAHSQMSILLGKLASARRCKNHRNWNRLYFFYYTIQLKYLQYTHTYLMNIWT
jgi:hypothetical protein